MRDRSDNWNYCTGTALPTRKNRSLLAPAEPLQCHVFSSKRPKNVRPSKFSEAKICVILRIENPSLRPTACKTNVPPGFYGVLSEDTIVWKGTKRTHKNYNLHYSLRSLTPLGYISKYSSGDASCLTSV